MKAAQLSFLLSLKLAHYFFLIFSVFPHSKQQFPYLFLQLCLIFIQIQPTIYSTFPQLPSLRLIVHKWLPFWCWQFAVVNGLNLLIFQYLHFPLVAPSWSQLFLSVQQWLFQGCWSFKHSWLDHCWQSIIP